MATDLKAGEESIYIESESPSPGWIRGKLKSNPKITDEEIDILDHTIKKSRYIEHSDEILKSRNNKHIFEIPKTMIEAQKDFLENEADRCYDPKTLKSIMPIHEMYK